MLDKQRHTFKIQAQYHEQEQPPWESFDKKIDKNFVRKRPSLKIVETMNRSIKELGRLLGGSGVNWHLDGALNISLMNGAGKDPEKYIGEHKDIDISVEKIDLAALEAHLLKNGYGLFLSRTEDKNKNIIMRRVGYKHFAESEAENTRLIVAINKNGKICRNKALNFVDVHIIQRTKNGEPLGIAGTLIPEKWTKPQLLEFHGQQIFHIQEQCFITSSTKKETTIQLMHNV